MIITTAANTYFSFYIFIKKIKIPFLPVCKSVCLEVRGQLARVGAVSHHVRSWG